MQKSTKRILNKKVALDKNSLLNFFDSRAYKYDAQHPYVSILYQDNNKDLATHRDHYEKNKIVPLLRLNGEQRLLDVGCGIGRWADATIHNLSFYLGLDFSANLIKRCRERFKDEEKASFIVMDAKNISQNSLKEYELFNRIIISGILIYMNDLEVAQALTGIIKLCTKNCVIYIREPLANKERLTLNEFWSDELDCSYSAIYRTIDEINFLVIKIFSVAGFRVEPFKALYPDQSMNNRSETSQFFTLFNNNAGK